MQKKINDMDSRDKIKAAGLKVTPQRILVYEVMQNLCHANLDAIIRSVHSIEPTITVSTVYRILEMFEEVGLISGLVHQGGGMLFDKNPLEHHHIFTQSGEIIDFDDEELSDIVRKRVNNKIGNGMSIKRIAIQIITTDK